jgi:hypothetical protein
MLQNYITPQQTNLSDLFLQSKILKIIYVINFSYSRKTETKKSIELFKPCKFKSFCKLYVLIFLISNLRKIFNIQLFLLNIFCSGTIFFDILLSLVQLSDCLVSVFRLQALNPRKLSLFRKNNLIFFGEIS